MLEEKEKEKEKEKKQESENVEVNMALNILMNVGIKLFNESTKEEKKKYQMVMKEADGYKKLFSHLDLCKNNKEREEICIILGRFYQWCVVPKEHEVFVNEFVKSLKSPLAPTNKTHIFNIILALISISTNNQVLLIDNGVVSFLFPLSK
jgi:hypothetical protein